MAVLAWPVGGVSDLVVLNQSALVLPGGQIAVEGIQGSSNSFTLAVTDLIP